MSKYVIFIYSFWIIIIFKNVAVDALAREDSGPYKAMLTSVRRCPKLQGPKEKKPTIIMSLEAYNNTKRGNLLRGNFTVLRDTSKLKGKSRQYRLINGKWKLNLVMHNGACDGIFITVLVAYLGGKHDTSRCSIPIGEYRFKDLDVNKVGHLWAQTMEYGRELWKIEASSPAGIIDCWDIFNVVVPV